MKNGAAKKAAGGVSGLALVLALGGWIGDKYATKIEATEAKAQRNEVKIAQVDARQQAIERYIDRLDAFNANLAGHPAPVPGRPSPLPTVTPRR